jgi:hypothetical protein
MVEHLRHVRLHVLVRTLHPIPKLIDMSGDFLRMPHVFGHGGGNTIAKPRIGLEIDDLDRCGPLLHAGRRRRHPPGRLLRLRRGATLPLSACSRFRLGAELRLDLRSPLGGPTKELFDLVVHA